MGTYELSKKRLNVKDFQHPADRAAVDAVMAVPALDKVLEFISKHSIERVYSFFNNACYIKVTPEISPKIHQMLKAAATMYGETKTIDIYLQRNYTYIADLNGIEHPHTILSTAWLEKIDDRMLWACLSTQYACYQAKHGTIEFIDMVLKNFAGMLPVGVNVALDVAINTWKRSRAYTADRAALLAYEDFGEAMKHVFCGEVPDEVLASMDLTKPNNDYYKQAVEFLQRSGMEGGIQKLMTVSTGNQWLASRYMELYNWYYSGEYDEVLERSVQA